MKLRIRGNSLRLRVTRPELEQLASGRPVIERLTFGAGAQLRYELSVDATAAALEASYNDERHPRAHSGRRIPALAA